MRTVLVALALAACAAPKPAPSCPAETPDPIAAAPAVPPPEPPPPPPTLDDAGAKAQSLALMAALDARDAAAFDKLTVESFTLYERARTYDKTRVMGGMTTRNDLGVPVKTRTCDEPRLVRGAAHVVYVASCVEQLPAYQELPAGTLETVVTLVWVLEGGGYKAAWFSIEKGGIDAEAGFWDDMYRTGVTFSRVVNKHLAAAVEGRKAGTALDLMMGQGRNAVYLATKGWKVTGVDISKEGVRQAVEAAAKQKKKLTGIVDNVETWDIGTGKWDLITMIYAGADETLIARAQKGVKKGGLFVTEYFHSDAGKGIGIGGYSTGQLAGLFANGWKIITDEVVEDTADFSLRKMKLVRFTAQKL